ncbi:MAG: response regulator [Bacteroidota bacterium]
MAPNASDSPPPLRKLSLMITDVDLYGLRDIQRYAMNHPQLEVTQASKTARGALNFFKQDRADVLVINPALPDANGFELIASIQPRPYIIVVADRPDYAYFSFEVGALAYLLKPVPHRRLDQVFTRILEDIRLRDELVELRNTVAQLRNTAENPP